MSEAAEAQASRPAMENHLAPTNGEHIERQAAGSLITPPSSNAVCDKCGTSIDGIRFKCQKCPDFDYCADCVPLASSIHPGHNFLPLRGHEPLDEEERAQYDNITRQKSLGPTTFQLIGHGTSMPPSLCLSCQPLTVPLPAMGTILQDEKIRRQAKTGLEFRWPARLSRLVEATVGGCAFCSLVIDRFFGPGNGIFLGWEPSTPWVCQSDHKRRQDVIQNAMYLLTLMSNDEFVFSVTPIRGDDMAETDFKRLRIELVEAKQGKEVLDRALASRGQQYIELDVYAAEGNPAADIITSRPPNPSPATPRALEQVRLWLTSCEREHGAVCSAGPSPLPSRVIDVSDGNQLRLLETGKDASGRYTALSYCWGEPQQFQTTQDSLRERLQGFSITDLPQTLQDAVTVTRALGIDYLWIDAICIVQDNATDRAHEIKGMADIYRQATVTIAASKAGQASKGFLNDGADEQTGLWKSLVPLAFPLANPAAKSITDAFQMPRTVLGMLWLCDEDPGMMNTFRSPVDRRGWCLQERLLSTRLLSYGRWPTWRCSLGTHSDGGFYPFNKDKEPHERQLTKCLAQQRRLVRESPTSLPLEMHTSNQLLQSWAKLLNDYTQRDLGVKADRLPAIGGIASEIARATGFEYLAGLWRPNLLHDLMWSVKTQEWLIRIEGYTGPTWSWAAVDCPVNYDDTTADSLALARVLSCTVEPGESGPFGEILSGRLELEGPLLRQPKRSDIIQLLHDQGIADAPPRSNDVQEWYRQIMLHIENQPKTKPGEKWEDSLPDDLAVLVTFSREWRVVHERRVEGLFYSGVILSRAQGTDGASDEFVRIAAFVNEKRDWLDLDGAGWNTEKVVLA
jgi:hypothetical protein